MRHSTKTLTTTHTKKKPWEKYKERKKVDDRRI
jgi:hypothetical protein